MRETLIPLPTSQTSMAGSSRLGFQPGRSYHNAVLAAMYMAVIVVVVGAVIATVVIPALSPSSSQPAAEEGGDVVPTSAPANSGSSASGSSSQATSGRSSNPTGEDESQIGTRVTLSNNQLEQQYRDTIVNNSNIKIVSAERRGDTFYVKYIPQDTSSQTLVNETGALLGAYSASTNYWDVERLHVTMLNENQQPVATYHADTQLMRQVQQGEMTRGQAINRTLNTINETPSSSNITISN